MTLKDKIISEKPRETSGSRVSNRFSFQHHYALIKMIEFTDANKEFVMVFDYHDDIIVLNNISDPTKIDFYQVKSNEQQSVHYLSSKKLTDIDKKQKLSFLGKMIDNYNKFKEETNSLNFVSNKNYNFTLKAGVKTKTEKEIKLGDLGKSDLDTIKNDICEICWKKDNCDDDCESLIYFFVTDLEPKNYIPTVTGQIVDFFRRAGTNSIDATAARRTLISEIEIKNNSEEEIKDFADLLTIKSISSYEFASLIDQIKSISGLELEWPSVRERLLSEGYSFNFIKEIKPSLEKYYLERDVSSTSLDLEFKTKIREMINEISDSKLKSYIDPILKELKKRDSYDEYVFPDKILIGMIIIEVYSDD